MVEENNKFKFISISGGILLFFYLIVLIIVKQNLESLKIFWFIFLIFLGILLYIVVVGGYWWMNVRVKKEEIKTAKELPKPITRVEAQEYAENLLRHPTYAELMPNPEYNGVKELGKNIKSCIYILYGKGKFEKEKYYCVMINMHYPDSKNKILINPTKADLKKEAQLLADFPEEEPSTEETRTYNPLLGIYQETKKRLKQEEKPKKEEKPKEEDL